LNLVYRRGGADDLTVVHELNRLGLAESWSIEGLRQALKDGYDLLLCLDGDTLAGYLLSHDVIDEVHIMQVVVAPPFRRRGIAEALSRKLIASKAGMVMLLEVRSSNHAAQALYEKLGFVRTGLRKRYYVPDREGGEREDAVLMSRSPEFSR